MVRKRYSPFSSVKVRPTPVKFWSSGPDLNALECVNDPKSYNRCYDDYRANQIAGTDSNQPDDPVPHPDAASRPGGSRRTVCPGGIG